MFAGLGRSINAGLQQGARRGVGGIAKDLSSSFNVQLATPGVSGNLAAGAVVDPSPPVRVSIVQNNTLTRDPLQELRESSGQVAAGTLV